MLSAIHAMATEQRTQLYVRHRKAL